MIGQPVRQPLGCWKAVLRRSRQEIQPASRSMASATALPPRPRSKRAAAKLAPVKAEPMRPIRFHKIASNNPQKPIRTAFAVYPAPTSIRKTHPSPMVDYHAQQIRRLDRSGTRRALFSKKSRDSVRLGDVLQVTTRRGEPFAGVCMSIRRAGVDSAILLRNHLTKIGVEMWYKIYSPSVVGIEIIWRRPKRARRARLTYMRQPKHDMGNVDHLVEKWRRSRNVFTTKGKKGKGKGKK